MPWKNASHIFFALTILAIGVIGLVEGRFAPIWGVVPKSLPDRQLLAYLCTFVSLACGAGLAAKRTAAPAALVLLIYLIVFTAFFKLPFIVRQPLVEGSYQTCGENAVLIAGAWALYVSLASGAKRWNVRFLSGDVGLRIAHVLYGLALIAFGFSHFAYLELTAPLVPSWLPGPVFWAYFTGTIYVVAGIAIVIGIVAALAAAVSALQIALITVLVWGPIALAGNMSELHWQETVVSCALTAAAWVVATSYKSPLMKGLGLGVFGFRRFARS